MQFGPNFPGFGSYWIGADRIKLNTFSSQNNKLINEVLENSIALTD